MGNVVCDSVGGSLRFGYVKMETAEAANKVCTNLHGTVLGGRGAYRTADRGHGDLRGPGPLEGTDVAQSRRRGWINDKEGFASTCETEHWGQFW